MSRNYARLAGLVTAIGAALCMIVAPVATATVRRITGSPLTLNIADDTSFQVRNANLSAGVGQFFPPECTTGADSCVFAALGGSLYAPNFAQHAPCRTAAGAVGPSTPWTPVSITDVAGSGTADDPFRVTVIADAGSSGVRLTAIYTYVNGDELFRLATTFCATSVTSMNVYLAADLYLATSDNGAPYLEPVSMSPGGRTCTGPPYTSSMTKSMRSPRHRTCRFSSVSIANRAMTISPGWRRKERSESHGGICRSSTCARRPAMLPRLQPMLASLTWSSNGQSTRPPT